MGTPALASAAGSVRLPMLTEQSAPPTDVMQTIIYPHRLFAELYSSNKTFFKDRILGGDDLYEYLGHEIKSNPEKNICRAFYNHIELRSMQ